MVCMTQTCGRIFKIPFLPFSSFCVTLDFHCHSCRTIKPVLKTWTTCSESNQRTQLLWSCCKRCRRRNEATSETLEPVVRICHCTVNKKERTRPFVDVLFESGDWEQLSSDKIQLLSMCFPKAPLHQTCFCPVYSHWNKHKLLENTALLGVCSRGCVQKERRCHFQRSKCLYFSSFSFTVLSI